jgi:dolichol-phosphate mannosyltransferase
MDGHFCAGTRSVRSLSLVIPAFNEEESIARAVREADEALTRLGCRYEILVVDDGSRDATAARVAAAAAVHPAVRLLSHSQNRGYGAALRTGFEAARYDRVTFTDADCQFHLDDLASLLPLTDYHPVAAGFRAHRQDTFLRRFYSWGYNRLVRALLGTRVRDCDCALKVFRRHELANLLPEANGFFANAEMLTRARQLGYSVAEVGVRHRARRRGKSKVSLGDVPRVLCTLIPFWWSRVLFAGAGPDAQRGPSYAKSAGAGPLLLVLVALLLFFTRLHGPLLEPEEARYAEIPRQMLGQGSWLVPVLHGQPYGQKPPLLYWLVMSSYAVFGVHDWAARLVPCAAGFLTVLCVYFWGRQALAARAALLGALVLCLSARFVYVARMLTMDGLLCLCVTASWASAWQAMRGSPWPRVWWLASAAACGLGILTKGPVALALVAVPLFSCQWLDPRLERPSLRQWGLYLLVSLTVSAPWYVAVAQQVPGFASQFLWQHNVLRYVAPLDHQEPFWFYAPGLLLGMLPWTLSLPALAKMLGKHSQRWADRRPMGLGLPMLACGWCFLFFSISGCKRPGYILPAMPALALALGWYLDLVMPRGLGRRVAIAPVRRLHAVPHQATLGVLATAILVGILATANGLLRPVAGVLVSLGALSGSLYLLRRGLHGRLALSWLVCGAVTFSFLFIGLHQLWPGYARKFSLRAAVCSHLNPSVDPNVPVACYPHGWDSVSFYLGRDDVRVYAANDRARLFADLRARPTTLLFVKSERYLKDLLRDLPASLEFVPHARHEIATAGFVCRRLQMPPMLMARR